MTNQPSHSFDRKLVVILLAAAVFCLATVLSSHAAVSAPVPPNVKPEDQFRADALAAQESIWRRTEIAKIRYQKKLEAKAGILQGMRAELEKRQATVSLPPAPGRNQDADDDAGDEVSNILIRLLLTLTGVFVFRHYWLRSAHKTSTKAHEAPTASSDTKLAKTRSAAKTPANPAVKPPIPVTKDQPWVLG